MKAKFKKEDINRATQIVSNIVTAKTPLTILNNVLMESISKQLVRFSATDLEVSICISIPAEVIMEGAITIPAKKLNDVICGLPEDGQVEVSIRKNNNIIIESGQCFFRLIGLPKDDFPQIPSLKKADEVKLKQATLSQMLSLTSFSVSYDDTRPALKGVLFIVDNHDLTLVATDGRRLALIKDKISASINTKRRAIVPSKAVQELNRSLGQEGEVKICFDENQIGFCFDDVIVISRLLEGNFPDYEQVIPKETKIKLRLDRERLLSAIKRGSLLTTQLSQKVKFDLFRDKIVIQGSSVELGEAKDEIEILKQDQEMSTAFNPGYLMDALRNIPANEVLFELTETEKPAAIRVEGLDYIYVVMPMKAD